MSRSRALAEFIPTQAFKPQPALKLVPPVIDDAPKKPHYSDKSAYSAWQKAQQEAQLQANLAAMGQPATQSDRRQQQQIVVRPSRSLIEQAAMQGEKGFAFKL